MPEWILPVESWSLPNEAVYWQAVVWAYLVLTGVGSGSLIVAILPRLPWAMDEPQLARLRRIALITALACFIAIPLGVLANEFQPQRIWRVAVFPNWQSVMPYGVFLLGGLILLTVFHLWHLHRAEMAWASTVRSDWLGKVYGLLSFGYDPDHPPPGPSETRERVLHVTRIVLEIGFVSYAAFLLSGMVGVSQGLWNTAVLGPLFFFMAMASGYAWLLVVGVISGFLRQHPRMLSLLAGSGAAFLAASLVTRWWEVAFEAYTSTEVWPAMREILFGVYAWSFLGIETLLGGIVAIALLAVSALNGDGRLALSGAVLGLLGLVLMRWHVAIGGQQISRTLEGTVDHDIGFLGEEGWIAAFGVFVIAVTIFLLLLWFLPYRGALHNTANVDESKPAAELQKAKSDDRRRLFTVAGGFALGAASGYATIRNLVVDDYHPREPVAPPAERASTAINSICLSCDARCGTRAIVEDGVVTNMFGTPFHPANTMNDPIPYDSSLDEQLASSGTLCLKGVSGMQYLYDPYRVRKPLKRTGPRGSGEFEVIEWDQLIEEVVEGGQLFADLGEDRHVEGLREVRDLDEPIDPDAPELGPKSYGLVWNTGRGQQIRTSFIQRFLDAYGTPNYVSHTDLCQLSWYTANYLFTGFYSDGEEGTTNQLFGDIVNSEYQLIFGVSIGAGWKPGVNTSAPILANRHADQDGHLVLIDPYAQHGRKYADDWVPINPATDAVMVLAMIRWMMEHEREDVGYLENTSRAAADDDGEPTWTNATYLVVVEEDDEREGRFLRAGDLGLDQTATAQDGTEFDPFVVLDAADGEPTAHVDTDAGQLYVDTTVTDAEGNEIAVKSSLQLLRDEAFTRTIEDAAAICDVPADKIEELVEGFADHGRKATASCYRGPTMHDQGIYAGLAINMLNALNGNMSRKGGVVSTPSSPAWDAGLFDLGDLDAPETEGAHIARIRTRSTLRYEDTTEYQRKLEENGTGYPSERPWFAFSHAGITTEALAAAETGYPYRPKIYINYYINQRHSIPGGITFEDTVADGDKIPLFLSVDTTINETSVYADYIIPDVMYLDGQYGFMGQQTGACTAPHAGLRHPAVEPMTAQLADGRHMMMETFLIDCARQLDLPGFGEDAIPADPDGPYAGEAFPLDSVEDFAVRAIGNFAFNAEVSEAPDEEVEYAERFPVARHKDRLPDQDWRRAVSVLVRGGYFEAPEAAWDDEERHVDPVELDDRAPLQFWHEDLGTSYETGTGRRLHGTATYREPTDGAGESLAEQDAQDYPFHVVTFRTATRTKARTAYDYWAGEMHPENRVKLNPDDAADLGVSDGDRVRIASPSNATEGVVRVSGRVKPGTIAGTHHYGHTQQGVGEWTIAGADEAILGDRVASPVLHGELPQIVDGDRVHGDARRFAGGFNVNDAMRRNGDEVLGDTPLVDNTGGGTVFLDSRVRIEPIEPA